MITQTANDVPDQDGYGLATIPPRLLWIGSGIVALAIVAFFAWYYLVPSPTTAVAPVTGTYVARLVGVVPAAGLGAEQTALLVQGRVAFGRVTGWTLPDGLNVITLEVEAPTQDEAFVKLRGLRAAVGVVLGQWDADAPLPVWHETIKGGVLAP
jgi:hypothetical protein